MPITVTSKLHSYSSICFSYLPVTKVTGDSYSFLKEGFLCCNISIRESAPLHQSHLKLDIMHLPIDIALILFYLSHIITRPLKLML